MNKNQDITILGHSALEREKRKRGIDTEPDWKNQNTSNEHSGINSIIQRARIAFSKICLNIKEVDSNDINDFGESIDNDNTNSVHKDFVLKDTVLMF